jgi:hypothetical protein
VLRDYFNIGGKTKWSAAALVWFQPHKFKLDQTTAARPGRLLTKISSATTRKPSGSWARDASTSNPIFSEFLDQLHRYDHAWQLHPLPLGLAPQIFDHLEEVRRFDSGFASARGLKSDAETCLLDG